jgi:hypothetical protein
MVQAGWMVETDGLLTLPNFDRHNGQTAKNRILTAKRVATHKKGNAEGNAKGNAAIVTRALPKEEKRREEKNTHTHTAEPEPIQLEDELTPHWNRWCEYCLAIGKPVNQIQADAILMDLGRRGTAKAIRDIDFSIRKSAKSILDSDNDFEKQATKPRTHILSPKPRNYT